MKKIIIILYYNFTLILIFQIIFVTQLAYLFD